MPKFLTRKKITDYRKKLGEYRSSVMIKTSMFAFLIFSSLVLSITLSLTEEGMHNAFATTTTAPSTPNSTMPLQEDARSAPKYSANSLDGKVSSLEDLRGNPVLINVWATWCIPCREEMPALEALYKEFSDRGLKIVGVSVDSHASENRIKSFIDRMGITYTIWHDPNDKFTRAFRTIGVPESFLINAQGQIVHTWKGPFDAMSQDTKARVLNVLSPESTSATEITRGDNNEVDISSKLTTATNTNTNNGTTELSSASPQVPSSSNSKQHVPLTTNSEQQEQQSSSYQSIGYPVAFAAGILSFLSPCILPLIPSYVAFITGMSMEELTSSKRSKKNGNNNNKYSVLESTGAYETDDKMSPHSATLRENYTNTSSKHEQVPSISSTRHISHIAIIRGLLFIAGFSVVFVALGASITAIGAAFSDYSVWIERIGGVMLVIFGLHLLGVLRIPGSEREWGFRFSKRPVAGHVGSFIIGMGFGAGWTPCIGPILASILTVAASSTSISTGVTLLSVYSTGLAIPFILSTVAVERFIIAFKKFRRWLPWVNRTSAALLIGVGIMLVTGMLTLLTGTLSGLGMPMNLG
jgi:cytochrome c-type biogenesis protein